MPTHTLRRPVMKRLLYYDDDDDAGFCNAASDARNTGKRARQTTLPLVPLQAHEKATTAAYDWLTVRQCVDNDGKKEGAADAEAAQQPRQRLSDLRWEGDCCLPPQALSRHVKTPVEDAEAPAPPAPAAVDYWVTAEGLPPPTCPPPPEPEGVVDDDAESDDDFAKSAHDLHKQAQHSAKKAKKGKRRPPRKRQGNKPANATEAEAEASGVAAEGGAPTEETEPAAPVAVPAVSKDREVIPSAEVWAWNGSAWILVPRPRAVQEGIFFAYNPIPQKQLDLLRSMLADKTNNMLSKEFLERELVSRLGGKNRHQVSLRLLDWLVVDFSRERHVAYTWRPGVPTALPASDEIVVMNAKYLTLLQQWRRRHLDPFRRRHRIYFTLDDGKTRSTTVAQLHFFYLARAYGFLEYATQNQSTILPHMKGVYGKANALKAHAKACGKGVRRQALVSQVTPRFYMSEGTFTVAVSGSDGADNADADVDGADGADNADADCATPSPPSPAPVPAPTGVAVGAQKNEMCAGTGTWSEPEMASGSQGTAGATTGAMIDTATPEPRT